MKSLSILGALLLVAASSSDDFARTVDALSASAEAPGTPAERQATGRILLAAGAHPIEGEDLARNWAGGTASRYRDRALGPAYRTIAVTPGGVAHFEQTFLAGQRAQIAIVPLDRARFALSVKDDQGASACSAPPGGRCSWMPLWTTRYGIDITNPGRATGRYYMVLQ